MGVDVLQLPKSYDGNRYAVVFVDYLTKWPEVFATADQSALTIAKLLGEHVISRHGVPAEVLSDRGASFLSNLMQEVCRLMGIKKVNTTAYHPQTDGLVERYNRTLIDMLAKTVDKSGQNWDTHLPYVLFAYRASIQESTRESPFYLLYGRDPRLPTEAALSTPLTRAYIDTDDYKTELTLNFTEAWDLARQQVEKAQRQQKRFYDRRSRKPTFRVGDRVFLYMPAAKTGQAYNLHAHIMDPTGCWRLSAVMPVWCVWTSLRTPHSSWRLTDCGIARTRFHQERPGPHCLPRSEDVRRRRHPNRSQMT